MNILPGGAKTETVLTVVASVKNTFSVKYNNDKTKNAIGGQNHFS